jgi:hypothetical protein
MGENGHNDEVKRHLLVQAFGHVNVGTLALDINNSLVTGQLFKSSGTRPRDNRDIVFADPGKLERESGANSTRTKDRDTQR